MSPKFHNEVKDEYQGSEILVATGSAGEHQQSIDQGHNINEVTDGLHSPTIGNNDTIGSDLEYYQAFGEHLKTLPSTANIEELRKLLEAHAVCCNEYSNMPKGNDLEYYCSAEAKCKQLVEMNARIIELCMECQAEEKRAKLCGKL